MNPLLLRLPTLFDRHLSHASARKSLQALACQTGKTWICDRCSQRQFLSSRVRRAQAHSQRPAARPPRPPTPTIRILSTSKEIQDVSKPRSALPSQEEGRRSHASKRFDHLMDSVQSNIFIAGQRLNDLTGYSGIEALKKDIEQQGMSSFASSLALAVYVLTATLYR